MRVLATGSRSTPHPVRWLRAVVFVVALMLMGTLVPGAASAHKRPGSPAGNAGAAQAGRTVEGRFDVGGHSLFIKCTGTARKGAPTVVYMHGWIPRPDIVPHRNAEAIRAKLGSGVRFCAYDRRNVGLSGTVDAVQTSQDAMRDMRRVLAAAGAKPPYVLLGASFGGLLSYVFANSYRHEVVGMVLLDAMFPDELKFEYLIPREVLEAECKDDEDNTLERICHWKVLKRANAFVGREPRIPMTYFASLQEPRNNLGIPEYDAAILGLQSAFVKRFSPGKEVWVDAPHFMEPAIPGQIAQAVRAVMAAAHSARGAKGRNHAPHWR